MPKAKEHQMDCGVIVTDLVIIELINHLKKQGKKIDSLEKRVSELENAELPLYIADPELAKEENEAFLEDVAEGYYD